MIREHFTTRPDNRAGDLTEAEHIQADCSQAGGWAWTLGVAIYGCGAALVIAGAYWLWRAF